MKKYKVNEIFYSIQGEGARAGTANVFIRFSNCNLRCSKEKEGFDCDTEFLSGTEMEVDEIIGEVDKIRGDCRNIIFTGGEPGLSLDKEIIQRFKARDFHLAVETNGTIPLPEGLDWICVSPKTALHTIKVTKGDEVKFVRNLGQAIPEGIEEKWEFLYWFISPSFSSDGLEKETLSWCVGLVKKNPKWRLSCQQHKWWGVR